MRDHARSFVHQNPAPRSSPPVSDAPRYAPGDTLPNGARVCQSECSPAGEYVLAKWCGKWVTWAIARDGATVAGHYFRRTDLPIGREPLADALADFRRRVAGRAA